MNFILRPWRLSDAESLTKYANNKKIADNLRNTFPQPYTLDDAKWFISNAIEKQGETQLVYAIEIDGVAAGSIGIHLKSAEMEKSAELGYWLGEPFWGNNIMPRAVTQICAEAFERFDIVRIYSEVFGFNKASQRTLEKAGFALEGVLQKSIYKNGQIFDSYIFAKIKPGV